MDIEILKQQLEIKEEPGLSSIDPRFVDIARVGENSPRLIENLKLLFIKLCNPVKYKLIDFLYKVIGIRSRSSLLSRVDSSDYQIYKI